MKEINLYKKPVKGLKLVALSLPFVAFGIWSLMGKSASPSESAMSWLCIGFFGLGILVGLFHIFDRRPQIVINETGIWDRTTHQDQVRWEQITDAYPLDIYRQKFVALVIYDTFVIRRKQYRWASKLSASHGAQDINLHLSQLKIDETKMTAFVKEIIAAEDRKAVIERYFD